MMKTIWTLMTSKRKKRLLKLLLDHIQQLKKQNENKEQSLFYNYLSNLKKGLLEKSLGFLIFSYILQLGIKIFIVFLTNFEV